MPIYHGTPSLLALHSFRFQEASEYHTYLLTNAIQLRISVLFNGHIETFVQEHWDKKIARHLKNLVKKYPWLAKVLDYDVRIIWEPKIMTGKKRRNIGVIADRMVEVLTGMAEIDLKRKRGFLQAELQVGMGAACNYVRQQQRLGLKDFVFFEDNLWKRHAREVTIAHEKIRAQKGQLLELPPHLKNAPEKMKDWQCRLEGYLFFRNEAESKLDGTVARYETITKPADEVSVMTILFPTLIQECSRG